MVCNDTRRICFPGVEILSWKLVRLDCFLNIQKAKAIGMMGTNAFYALVKSQCVIWRHMLSIAVWRVTTYGGLINTLHVQQLPAEINNWKYLLQTLHIDSIRTQNTHQFLDTEYLIQTMPSCCWLHSPAAQAKSKRVKQPVQTPAFCRQDTGFK